MAQNADNVRINSRGRAVANIGRRSGSPFTRLTHRTTVLLFLLVPQVRLKKRLDVEGAHARALDRLPGRILARLEEPAGGG
jgi:hypothetical protein